MTSTATIATVPWLSPQQKQVVDELRALGGRGVTVLESSRWWPAVTALSQRVGELRKMTGPDGTAAYVITGEKEGKHDRYRLVKDALPGIENLKARAAGIEQQATCEEAHSTGSTGSRRAGSGRRKPAEVG